jgi:hypothetical protein
LKLLRQRILVEIVRQRPRDPGGGGELQVFANDPCPFGGAA